MSNKFKSVIVPRADARVEPAVKALLDKDGVIWCQVLDSDAPYYLRLKVRLPYGAGAVGEVLLPHSVVALILIDAPEKTLGFRTTSVSMT